MKRFPLPSSRRRGFSLVEVLLAVTISMVLLYAAIFSASEALAVVSEGDAQMHTHVQARRALDRILTDVRYASEVTVAGDLETGWTLDVLTTGSLSAGWVEYAWDAASGLMTVATAAGTEWMLEGVRSFQLDVETVQVNGVDVVGGVILKWVVAEDDGGLTGEAGLDPAREIELSGSARLRIHD